MAILVLALVVVFCSTARGADEYVKVPIKVNVLKGVDITDEEIKEIVKEANKILKQAKIAFDDPNIVRDVNDLGNNDSKIQNSEENKLDEAGQKELNDNFGGGKGIKIYITNQIRDSNFIMGLAPHVTEDANGNLQGKPIIYLKREPDESNEVKGNDLAHESCHVFTLKGHVDDPNNLMYTYNPYTQDGNEANRGTILTGDQIDEVLEGAKRHAKKAKVGPPKEIGILPIIQGGFVDDMGEPNTAYSDLGAGFLFAEDQLSNLEISLLLEGTFPSDPLEWMVFSMYFNVDNNDLTGASYGSATGIDKVLDIELWGTHPGGPVTAWLFDVATEQDTFLPFGSTQRIVKIIDKTEYPYPPEVEDYVDGLYQQVPLPLLNITANEVPVWVTSENFDNGDYDEAEFTWQLFDPSAPVFELLTTRLEAGEQLEFTGCNFTPDSQVQILLDDEPVGSVLAQPDGTIEGNILLDLSYYVFDVDDECYDFFFVTARDPYGKSDFSIVELVPNEVYICRHKLTASDAAVGDRFGYSVALSGNTAIVGAILDDDAGSQSGSAYLFDTASGSQLFKLTASDAAADNFFGCSVSISGNRAIVGARRDDDAGSNSGSAYLFDVSDPCNPTETYKLTASDAAAGDEFGDSVAISGNTAIVGASWDDDPCSDSGSAYLFDAATGSQLAKLTASDVAAGDRFGHGVAISGNTAIVGAYKDDDAGNDSGSAYLFDVSDPCNPVQMAKLTASDAAAGDLFGCSVSISGNRAIVGAAWDDSKSGSAYLFDVSDPCNPLETYKLTASDAAAGDIFGFVSISGNMVIVGAERDDHAGGTDSGSVYLFDVTTGSQLFKLTAFDAAAEDSFGYSAAISGPPWRAIVGAIWDDDAGSRSGSAYVFDVSCPYTIVGDINEDCRVDFRDFALMAANWLVD